MVLYLAELSLPHCLDALHSHWPSHPLSTPARFIIALLPSSPSCNDASLASGFGQDLFILIYIPCLGPPFCPKNVWIFRRNPSNVTTCMSPLLSVIIAVCCPFFLLQKPFFIRGQLNPSQRGEWPPKTKWRGDCCIHSRSKVYINTKQHIIFRNITFFNS